MRTASQVFGVPERDVTPEQRARTKAINFGIIYGQSGFGLARNLGISQSEAREQIDAYFARYPGVRAFIQSAIKSAEELGYARTMAGRRRYLPDLRSRQPGGPAGRRAHGRELGHPGHGRRRDQARHGATSTPTCAVGLVPSARMILQVHDELVFEVAPADLERLSRRVTERMQRATELSVPLEVHVGSGAELAGRSLEMPRTKMGPGRISPLGRRSKAWATRIERKSRAWTRSSRSAGYPGWRRRVPRLLGPMRS